MASKIEWTDETWNPIRARNRATGGVGHYCAKVSAGCQGCYAERLQKRFNNPIRYAAQDRDKVDIFLDEEVLLKPLAWKKPRVVFPCSMTDLFGDWVTDDMLDHIFGVMGNREQHTFKILTKRPERQRDYVNSERARKAWNSYRLSPDAWPARNLQLGCSVEDQESADARIPALLETNARKRIVSYEPALGPVDFTRIKTRWGSIINALTGRMVASNHSGDVQRERLDQVIAGGKSGPLAVPSHPDWFRAVRDQCVAAGVPFFFKQWGEWAPVGIGDDVPEANGARLAVVNRSGAMADARTAVSQPTDAFMWRVGKKEAGRLLDGAVWDQQP